MPIHDIRGYTMSEVASAVRRCGVERFTVPSLSDILCGKGWAERTSSGLVPTSLYAFYDDSVSNAFPYRTITVDGVRGLSEHLGLPELLDKLTENQ